MFNKYGKFIYSLIIFYVIWLVGIPLGFSLAAQPVLKFVRENTEFNIFVDNPQLRTSVLPNIKIRADKIRLLNKDHSEAVLLNKPFVSLRILPLISGRVHINSFQSDEIGVNGLLKDKLYIGDFPLEITDNNLKAKIKRIKILALNIKIDEPDEGNNYFISGNNLYFKNTRTSFISHGKVKCNFNNHISVSDFDINLPHSKNLKKTKFNINIEDLSLNPFSDLINRCVYNEITSLEGSIDLHSDNRKLSGNFENIRVNYKDSNKSIIFP